MYRIVWFLLSMTCSLLSMQQHVDEVNVQRQIQLAVESIRLENDYDPSIVPTGFDAPSWGEIIKFDPRYQCAVTHCGAIYHYDIAKKWHCIHRPKTVFEDDIERVSQFSNGIMYVVASNNISIFAYSPSYQTLISVVPRLQTYKSSMPAYVSSWLCVEKPNDDHDSFEFDGDIYCIALNERGDHCANGRYKNFCFTLSTSHITKTRNPIVFTLACYPQGTRGVLEDLSFASDTMVHVTTISSDKEAYRWQLDISSNRRTKKPCVIDCGHGEYLSLAKAYDEPSLYKQLKKGGYRYRIVDPRFSVFMNIVHNPDGVVPDIVGKIAQFWYDNDEKLQENTQLVYGSTNRAEDKDKIKHRVLKTPRENSI